MVSKTKLFWDSAGIPGNSHRIPGFQDSRKKKRGFQGIPRDSKGFREKKVADSTGFRVKKVADSKLDSGSHLGICAALGLTIKNLSFSFFYEIQENGAESFDFLVLFS